MKQAGIGALLLLLIGTASWLLLNQNQPATPDSTGLKAPVITNSSGIEPETAIAFDTPVVESTPEAESASVTALRTRIDDLKATLNALAQERESAELELEQAEYDVTELEQFVADIKARGEDPTDYADEGLARFEPAFHAYQKAFDKLEETEALEEKATQELRVAEAKLRNMPETSR